MSQSSSSHLHDSTADQAETQQPSITFALSLWSTQPALPLIETAPRLPHTLLFVPGLQDCFGTVPYLERLAIDVAPLGFNVVQPQLSSSLGGYGVSSIEADAQEIALVMRHLRTRKSNAKHPDAKVVVMGHSTGCQDMAQLLLFDRPGVGVDGVILQAPVSDREDFEQNEEQDGAARDMLKRATALVESGNGAQLLERNIPPTRQTNAHGEATGALHNRVNADAIQRPAMTAYRYWALHAKGGDDDYFSTDLSEEVIGRLWQTLLGKDRYVAALLGAEDEYGPTTMKAAALAEQWTDIVHRRTGPAESQRFRATAIPGANHKVEGADGQAALCAEVHRLLMRVLGEDLGSESGRASTVAHPGTSQAHPQDSRGSEPYPASFDEVVELISTGRTDCIPGVKNIPLQLNDTIPSEPSMSRPPKPWERGQ